MIIQLLEQYDKLHIQTEECGVTTVTVLYNNCTGVGGLIESPNIPTPYQTTRDTVRDEGYEQLLITGVQHL